MCPLVTAKHNVKRRANGNPHVDWSDPSWFMGIPFRSQARLEWHDCNGERTAEGRGQPTIETRRGGCGYIEIKFGRCQKFAGQFILAGKSRVGLRCTAPSTTSFSQKGQVSRDMSTHIMEFSIYYYYYIKRAHIFVTYRYNNSIRSVRYNMRGRMTNDIVIIINIHVYFNNGQSSRKRTTMTETRAQFVFV